MPPGFRIAVYAADVPNARQMALGPPGVVFVGSRARGQRCTRSSIDGDGNRADEVHVPPSGLNMPSGVAFRDGALYVAAVDRDPALPPTSPANPATPADARVVVSDAYPSDTHHGWKFIALRT